MDIEKTFPDQLLEGTIGIPIEIISNDFQEIPGYEGSINTKKVIFQPKKGPTRESGALWPACSTTGNMAEAVVELLEIAP